jgi:hypothetical protein
MRGRQFAVKLAQYLELQAVDAVDPKLIRFLARDGAQRFRAHSHCGEAFLSSRRTLKTPVSSSIVHASSIRTLIGRTRMPHSRGKINSLKGETRTLAASFESSKLEKITLTLNQAAAVTFNRLEVAAIDFVKCNGCEPAIFELQLLISLGPAKRSGTSETDAFTIILRRTDRFRRLRVAEFRKQICPDRRSAPTRARETLQPVVHAPHHPVVQEFPSLLAACSTSGTKDLQS